MRLAPFSWGFAALATGLLFLHAVPDGDDASLKFATLVLALCGILWAFPFSGRRERRFLISLFLLAFAVRLGAAVLFDLASRSLGDPYGGSPDAWAYDHWARRLVWAWSELRDLNLHAYSAAGRWDVGFHYVLGAFYALFGESVLAGRLLAAFFGALAVVLLFSVARRVAGESKALIAGLLYAFWISSIVWSTYSVLRDSMVWALTLLAVWLALRVIDGSAAAGVGFFFVLVCLRTIRPYAAILVVIGLGIAAATALLRRDRGAFRPAIILATTVLAAEVVFFATGFPNAVSMVTAYQPRRVLLRPLTQAEGSKILAYPRAVPGIESELEEEFGPETRRGHLLKPSLPANTLRFFVSPPAWAPIPGGYRRPDNWPLPGMWLWYAILPIGGLGFFLSLRASPALRSLVITAGLFCLVLIIVGRGDFTRQREMVVPIVLLCFAVGVGPSLQRPRLLLVVYLLYLTILGVGIVYHRGTLRARGLAGLELSPRPRMADCPWGRGRMTRGVFGSGRNSA